MRFVCSNDSLVVLVWSYYYVGRQAALCRQTYYIMWVNSSHNIRKSTASCKQARHIMQVNARHGLYSTSLSEIFLFFYGYSWAKPLTAGFQYSRIKPVIDPDIPFHMMQGLTFLFSTKVYPMSPWNAWALLPVKMYNRLKARELTAGKSVARKNGLNFELCLNIYASAVRAFA